MIKNKLQIFSKASTKDFESKLQEKHQIFKTPNSSLFPFQLPSKNKKIKIWCDQFV